MLSVPLDFVRCPDYDECAVPKSPCGVNEVCHNKVGSYECKCQGGYRYQQRNNSRICQGNKFFPLLSYELAHMNANAKGDIDINKGITTGSVKVTNSFLYSLYLFIFFLFLRGIYNTRTCRQIRTDITVLTQIALITNYREATLYYKKYITNLNIMNGKTRKQGLDNSYCCIKGSRGFHFLSWKSSLSFFLSFSLTLSPSYLLPLLASLIIIFFIFLINKVCDIQSHCQEFVNSVLICQNEICARKSQHTKLLICHLLDIDECSEGENECDRAAWCKNTVGGYVCNCKEGYRKTEGGKCEGNNEHCIFIQYKGITKQLALRYYKGHYLKITT